MIHEAIATGATVDEARANAIAELKAPKDADVHTEILAMPTKKILGLFGGSPAKARAYYETPDAPKAKEAAPKAAPKKAEKPAAKAEKPAEVKAEVKAEAKPAEVKAEAEKSSVEIDIASSKSIQSAVDYLSAVLKGMGVAEMSAKAFRTSDDEIILELDCGEDYGIVIGRRGETLDSIQYLTRLVANKYKTENEYARISINIGSYREKRKNTLRALAKKNSEKVLKYGRNVTFEPMNPYERRIIHTAVQEIEGVTSHSVGSDSNRRVVITLAEGVKPTHPSKGGYNRGRGGKGGYNNRGRDRRNNNSYTPSGEQRAPRTDAGAQKVSLYGKIN
ncbi:MAG: Jag N-terminal domain-containing protein [Clostridia bacterium]|nr:Jag N-terminal domain-containing protein [Clostridia bacterium]MBQ5904334.1 Jag N-terminal domain-containing protein [Clostridia bacterium]